MNQGDTCTYNGSEVALFPLDYIYITQIAEPGAYSHCCGHATDFAFPSDHWPVYAPFTCTLFESSGPGLGNRRSYVSDNPVWTVNWGLVYVTVSFTHDDNPPTQTHFNQGQLIAHSGRAGGATGDHIHIDASPVANATLIFEGDYCQYGQCWHLNDDEEPETIFYTTGTETLAYLWNKTFTDWTGSPIVPGSGDMNLLLCKKAIRRRKYGI